MTKQDIKATIFIPTWFGEQYLDEVLTSIFRQKVPYNFEVLIYDTSSKDSTPAIIEKHAKKHKNLRHKTIAKSEFGHGKTRDAAAHDAKGEIVVYISQDVTPAHDRWLYEIVRPFEISDSIVGVTGKQDPRPHCIPLLKSEIRAVFRGFGPDFGTTVFYKDDFVKDQGTYDAISFYSDVNSAARRSFLTSTIPYQDVPYAEDQLMGRDIIDAGYKKVYAPRANVVHSNDMTLGEYKSRMFDETMGLRKIGIPVNIPSKKLITRMIIRGALKDCIHIIRDRDYSFKRKLYWLVMNPFFHVEKWRGVRLAAQVDMQDSARINRYSLESIREQR
ncbi:rhamnosyl transferase [Candidatus Saccharibacteria bacterium RIFCSPHIGHO2_01_FULL_45_15]|nr:MAG: rhamnosyl transferase [Candidatus Saccharibacteria bacterium RIFCSPHIGHO2_01_FULL_45_15]OGL27143.1 MAG: rhamnosyl transferase [Candidatus Saccharibacteria bacterium RIFCSPHIGHO2_02_FULL_46_12]OGL32819.1 MAG: rhamnosyl transferase [Candidatus Saccharibacteria bacterium RIFCSPHIGHO2_12_FULL_44_22]